MLFDARVTARRRDVAAVYFDAYCHHFRYAYATPERDTRRQRIISVASCHEYLSDTIVIAIRRRYLMLTPISIRHYVIIFSYAA